MSDVHVVATQTHGRVLVRRAESPRGILAGFHGYSENAAIQLARLEAIPGSAAWTLVSIQGLHRFYRGRTQEVMASWMTREDRDHAIADNIAYVEAALGAAGCAAATPVVYVGFSQGVSMALRAALRGRARAAGAIAVGGDVPPELLADASLAFPPLLLARGASDAWYTAAKMEADVAALRARGVTVQTIVYPAAHEWTPAVEAAAGEWLAALATS